MGSCECGCGAPVRPGRRFLREHASRKRVPQQCRHGCSRTAHQWSLGHHEKNCITTYDRLIEVLVDRHFLNVGDPDKCWVPDPTKYEEPGYRVKIGGQRAHVVACELRYGPLPAGHVACHTCDVRNCANPCHVWPGTQADNLRDMRRKGRGANQFGVFKVPAGVVR